MNDAEQTRLLRQMRVNEKRSVKELNQTGRRLEWVRKELELTQRQVCEATGIPASSYCGREAGIRPELAEEFVVLSRFFNELWRQRFNSSYPQFGGQEVKKITAEWMQFGYSDIEANAEIIIEEYQIRIKELEEDSYQEKAEMRRQLELFVKEEG